MDSIIKKVAAQARRLSLSGRRLCLTGGLCESVYIRGSLAHELGAPVAADPLGRYAGAIGAALCALAIKK